MKTLLSLYFQSAFMIMLGLALFQTTKAQEQLTNLPTIYITTDNGQFVKEKEVYLKGKITIKSSVPSEVISNVVMEIKGRGNSTWNMPKKPFRIKLDKKASLLGLPAKEKNWVLLANYADKTLMRNAVAFKISEITGLEFTPSVRFVDVVFNNEFLGNYILTDQVEVADFRVPVEKQEVTDTTEPAVTGGYLLEIDGFAASEPKWFTTPQGLKVTVKYPKDDEINDDQMKYITDFTRGFENILFSQDFKNPETGYRVSVDTVSLVNWYIGCELSGNSDSFWSTYIYKKRLDDKFYFGPMWDYDIAFNNDSRLGNAQEKAMREVAHQPRTWIEQLWKDEWFQKAVERRWKELVNDGLEDKIVSYINETEALLQSSQTKNYEKWKTLNTKVHYEIALFPTYTGGVDFLRSYVRNRITFLSRNFTVKEPEKPTPPFEAGNFYYRILNKKTNSAIDVTDESTLVNAPLMMWAPKDGDATQLWSIQAIGTDLFRFVNKNSGLAMAAAGKDNNLVQVKVDNRDNNQKWQIIPLFTGGVYGIVNPASGLSVNNKGGNLNDGNPVIVYDNNITNQDKVNQHWYLNKVEELMSTTSNKVIFTTEFFCYAKDQRILYNNIPDNSIIRLYNMQGNMIYERKDISGSGELEINLRGVYILRIISNEGIQNTKIIL